MQTKSLILLVTILISAHLSLKAQYAAQNTTYKKCFVGSTFFLLGNFAKTNKPDFAQLNFGYRLTGQDVISVELKTWKYAWPLGIPPFGSSFEAPGEEFPGYIREFGFALVYQHFWWKGLYTAIHMMPAWQRFVDENDHKIDNGFQLFNTYRLGYHIKLFNNHFFIEPSIAITHRPFHTEMPASFKQKDDQWSKFFFGEPGLHFGFNF
jgi:hypothetical protein